MEAARDDLKTLFENQTETVHGIKPASRRYASNKYRSNTGMKPSAENCSKSGEQHPPRKCKAYGKVFQVQKDDSLCKMLQQQNGVGENRESSSSEEFKE